MAFFELLGWNRLAFFKKDVMISLINKGPFLIGGPVSFLRKDPFVKVAP
jgi:hypothetical protein